MRNRIKIKNNNLGSTGTATLLWTNENPSVAFAAQTISLDLSTYKGIGITFTTYSKCYQCVYASKNVYDGIKVDGGGNGNYARSFTSNDTSVIIKNCYRADNIEINGSLIPLYIYGLK